VEAPRIDESLPVPREFAHGHFIVEVNGQSMEPDFMDGERWIIDGRDKYTPKNGAVCVVSDGYGSYLKRWDKPRKAFVSINPKFPDILPATDAKLQGYPVERLK
jgi:phage repressor protein C with HTH and peptisase S24 domain